MVFKSSRLLLSYTVTILLGKSQANYHKWLAVIANHRNGLESLDNKIKGYPKVRNHLLDACKINPKDFTGIVDCKI